MLKRQQPNNIEYPKTSTEINVVQHNRLIINTKRSKSSKKNSLEKFRPSTELRINISYESNLEINPSYCLSHVDQ